MRKISRVNEHTNAKYGLYMYIMTNGKPFTDGRGNVLNIPGRPFDIEKLNAVNQAAKYYGAPAGEAKFIPGIQRVSEMRASEETGRMREGLIASETDIGAWRDAQRGYEQALREGWDYDG